MTTLIPAAQVDLSGSASSKMFDPVGAMQIIPIYLP